MNSKTIWFNVTAGFSAVIGIWVMVAGTPEPSTNIPPLDGLLSLASLAEERWGQMLAGFGTLVGGFLLALTSFLPNGDGADFGYDGDGGD